MENIKIHTIEFSYYITSTEYKTLSNYCYSQEKKCFAKNNVIQYLGFSNNGIRIFLEKYIAPECITKYKLKYIITPSRYKNENDYLSLTDISNIISILNDIGIYLNSEYELLPNPLDCNITRIDFTRNIYVGNNIEYIIQLLNRCYKPYCYKKNFKNTDNNATFTKYNSKNKKLFEISFYDKFAEMKSHIDNYNYKYQNEILNAAKGILRLEFRFYEPRLKNLKKTYKYDTIIDFFEVINHHIKKIINKNLQSLYFLGDFYKLEIIKDKVNFSNYKNKTKIKMIEFILSSANHKNANIAALNFIEKYGEKELNIILKNFNKLNVIPVPISIRQPFDKWCFID